ncbi:hypothetical protein CCACVL1_08631, partial [Corchorus capsularis]
PAFLKPFSVEFRGTLLEFNGSCSPEKRWK